MPRFNTFGSASAAAFSRGRAYPKLIQWFGFSNDTLVRFPTSAPGDLAIVINSFQSVSTPSGWTLLTNDTYPAVSYSYQAFSKVLNSSDIASGTDFGFGGTGGLTMCFAYRGVSNVIAGLASFDVPTNTDNIITPFTKDPRDRWLLTACVARDTSAVLTPPAGFADIFGSQVGSGFFTGMAAHGPPTRYADMSSVGWQHPGSNPSINYSAAQMFELY